MAWLERWEQAASAAWARLRSLVAVSTGRGRFEREMDEELRFHLEAVAADLVRSGVPAAEAARRARMALGSADTVRQDCRESRGLRLVDALQQDVRHAVRGLLRTRGFTAAAVGTLALCLGANLTIFAVVDAVLLRALPFPDAERLVGVFNTYPRANVLDDGSSLTNYDERRGRIAAVESLSIYRESSAVVGETGATEREPVLLVSAEFFNTLRIAPALGSRLRTFNDRGVISGQGSGTNGTDLVPMSVGVGPGPNGADLVPGVPDAVVVTDGYWRDRLGGDPRVIGRAIRVDGERRTVVAVLSPQFTFLSSEARLFLPLVIRPEDRTPARRHSGSSTRMVARLAAGATLAEAQAQIDAHNAGVEQGSPQAAMMAEAGFRSLVVPLRAHHVASVRPLLLLLQAGALLLLLIGVANLVNLCLVRASTRLKEMAVRHALGVSGLRVASQVLVETILLTSTGGLLGLAAGAAGIRALSVLDTDRLPMAAHVAFDARLALVALAGAVVVGLIVGAPIAWYHLRSHREIANQFEGRGGTGSRAAHRLRHGFVVAQIALALMLLSAAGLLGLSLERTMALDPGFRADGVAAGRVTLARGSYPTGDAMLGFVARLRDALAREPGVVAAAVATNVPLSGLTIKSAASTAGTLRRPGESPRGHYGYAVTADYFAALGIPLREGRVLDARDDAGDARVCVVDEDFARGYWPDGRAVGQPVFLGSEPGPEAEAFTVVGVVGAVKQAALTEVDAPGALFIPLRHNLDRQLFVVVRSQVPAELLAARLPRVVRAVDRELPMSDVRTMDARIAQHLVARRSPALLAALFSTVALLLTAVGTYGVLSYAVAQRRREIGLRVALGARPSQVRGAFMRTAMSLLASGAALGLAGAWLAGRALQGVLFRVPAVHPAVLAGATLVIGVVCVAACLLPAHRASTITPLEVLSEP